MISMIELNEELGTMLYTARNYKGYLVYVVCYGLQHIQSDSLETAYGELNDCKVHALANR